MSRKIVLLIMAMLAVLLFAAASTAQARFDYDHDEVEAEEEVLAYLSSILDDEDFEDIDFLSEKGKFDLGCTMKCSGFWLCVGTKAWSAYKNKSISDIGKALGCEVPSGCICHKPYWMV